MKKISKTNAKEQIEKFFLDISNKSPKEIEKIKKLAMSYNIKLKDNKKSFCEKCLIPYKNPKIRIKNKNKVVICNNCGYVSRWKL